MKRRHFIFSLTVFLFLPLATVTAGNRDSQWKQVEEAVAKGLPQTAIDLLKPIIEAALQEKAYPEAIKAIRQRIDQESRIEGNWYEQRVARWEAEIVKAPPAVVPVMRLILADCCRTCLYSKINEREWLLRQRGTAAGAQDESANQDLLQFWVKADEQFKQALAAEAELENALCGIRGRSGPELRNRRVPSGDAL